MATATQVSGQIEGLAKARFIRVSPQKARLVIDLIRGQRAEDALQTLRFTKKRVAKDVEKTLRSAIANAERKAEDAGESLDVDELYVTRCFVNEGPRWKRMRPGADGPRLPLPEAYELTSWWRWPSITAPRRIARPRLRRKSEASKGVKGAVRKARKAIEKRAKGNRRKRRSRRLVWGRKHIRTDFGWATTRVGSRAGSRSKDYADLLHEDVPLRKQLKETAEVGGRRRDRHRARRQQAGGPNLHRAPGHHHRPQGLGNRQAEERSAEAHQPRSAHRYSGSAPSGAGCASWWRNRSRCSWKSAWRSGGPCARRWIRRCVSAARESRCAWRAG